jgi:hypothetical protein
LKQLYRERLIASGGNCLPRQKGTESIEHVVYTVRLAETDDHVEIVSSSVNPENGEKLIDFLDNIIPREQTVATGEQQLFSFEQYEHIVDFDHSQQPTILCSRKS